MGTILSKLSLFHRDPETGFRFDLPNDFESDQHFLTSWGWMTLRQLLEVKKEMKRRNIDKFPFQLAVYDPKTKTISYAPLQDVAYSPSADGAVLRIFNAADRNRASAIVTEKQQMYVYQMIKNKTYNLTVSNIPVLQTALDVKNGVNSNDASSGSIIWPVCHAPGGRGPVPLPPELLQPLAAICPKHVWAAALQCDQEVAAAAKAAAAAAEKAGKPPAKPKSKFGAGRRGAPNIDVKRARQDPTTTDLARDFMWIVGLFTGDGSLKATKGTGSLVYSLYAVFRQNKRQDIDKLIDHLEALGLIYTSGNEDHLNETQELLILAGQTACGFRHAIKGDSHQIRDPKNPKKFKDVPCTADAWRINLCLPTTGAGVKGSGAGGSNIHYETDVTPARYNKNGALVKVDKDGKPVSAGVAYNEGVWRISAPKGCGIITRNRGTADFIEKPMFVGEWLDLTISRVEVEPTRPTIRHLHKGGNNSAAFKRTPAYQKQQQQKEKQKNSKKSKKAQAAKQRKSSQKYYAKLKNKNKKAKKN
jgi:hypothetical protein